MTIFEQALFEDLATDYILQFQDAIKNKPIRRKSVYNPDGFEATVNASGKLHDSPRIEVTENSIDVHVLAYIDDLVYGKPPSKVNKLDIEVWLQNKGLQYSATSIVENIKDFGNSIFIEHQGANSGLLDDIDISEMLDTVKQKLITKRITEIKHANSN